MKNKNFDNIDELAQNAFENFEVEFDPMGWAALQSKLRTESSIDQVAKNALEDYKVSFDKKDWIRLEKQLDKERDLAPHVWWLKSTEVGTMALLLFTIFNLTSSNKTPLTPSNQNYDRTTTLTPSSDVDNAATKNQNKTFQLQEKDASSQSNELEEPQAFNEQVNSSNPTIIANASSDDNSNNNSFNGTPSVAVQKKNRLNSTVATNTTTDDKNASTVLTTRFNNDEIPNQTNNGFTGEDGIVNTLSPTENDATNNLTGIENTAVINRDNEEAIAHSLFSILQIPTLDVKEGIKTTDPIFELKKAKLELPFKGKNYIGAVVRIGSNFETSMGGTSVGYGGGLVFTSEFSPKIALRTGAVIAYNKYDTHQEFLIEKIDGNSLEVNQYKTNHLVIIEIPLEMQYTFFQNDKWKIYGTAGLVANIISSRTYTGSQVLTADKISSKYHLNSNDFERGIFEGGQLNQNAFLSISGGVGLERQLGDKISLYILPTYRHGITPSGSGKDYIHSFGVNIGIKTSL